MKTSSLSIRIASFFICILAFLFQSEASATLSGRKIGLDPGHGAGVNRGVYIAEGTWTLDAAIRAQTHLTNDKANVVMTRTTGADPSLGTRQNILNSNNVHVMVSLHSNAATAAAVGIETYYCSLSHGTNSKKLADRLRIRALNMVHNKNRGTKECLNAGRGFHFGMLRYTNMPASLPEYYFHTNPWENQNLHNTTTGRENIARSLYAAVCDYYGQTPVFGGGTPPPAKSTKFKTNDWVKVVDTDTLNLRSGPSTSSTVITALPRNKVSQVKSHSNNGVYATNNHWWYVETHPEGTKGWLAEYYLTKTSTPIKKYKLTTQTAGSGSVSRSPNATEYNEGTKVTLTAKPGANYTFSHWSNGATGSSNPITVTMNKALTVKAHFTENTKHVDRIVDNKDSGFSASSNWDTATWADDKYKDDYAFRAVEGVSDPATWKFNIPYSGTYLIYAWWAAFDNRSEKAPYVIYHQGKTSKVEVNQRKDGGKWMLLGSYKLDAGENQVQLSCWAPNSGNDIVVADAIRFVTYDEPPPIPKYALTTKTSGSGSITKSPNASTYDEGTKVILTAKPAKYHTFSHWSGDASGTNSTVTVTMDKAKTVTAHFDADPASVDIIVDNSDSGFTASSNWKTSTSGSEKYGSNYLYRDVEGVSDAATWKADLPFAGTYEVFAWWPSGSKHSEAAPYVVYHKDWKAGDKVTKNQRKDGGKWNSLGTFEFDAGETKVDLSCWAPNSGDDTVAADAIRFVTYDGPPPPPKFALTTQAEGLGSIARDPDAAEYVEGAKVELTAAAASTHTFSHWSGDASGSANPVTVTMDKAKTVKAHFAPKNFSLALDTEGPGTLQQDPAGNSHPYGSKVTITAVPDANYELSHWSGGASGSENPLTLTIDGNKTVKAHFILKSYKLTTQTDGPGSLTINPDKEKYDHGSTVTLTAKPNEGQILARWSGDASGNTNPLTVTMNSAKTIKAHFEKAPPTVDLIIDNSDSGFSASSNWETSTSGNEKYGSNYLYRDVEGASDAARWSADLPFAGTYEVFAWWPSGSKHSEAAPYVVYHKNWKAGDKVTKNQRKDGGKWNSLGTFEFDAGQANVDLSCWAPNSGDDIVAADAIRFVTYDAPPPPKEFALNIQTEGSGSIEMNPNAAKHVEGTKVTLTAQPDEGFLFSSWSGDATGNKNPITVTMDAAKTIKATFIPNTHKLIAETNHGGSILQDPLLADHPHGSKVELTAVPDEGFKFIEWSVDSNTSTENPFTLTMDSSKTVLATFAIETYTVNIDLIGSGTVHLDPDLDKYDHGTSLQINAIADPGYEFIGWSGDADNSENPLTITVDSAKSISAEFIRSYTGWRDSSFAENDRNDPSVSGPDADPKGHGIPNLLKFAFGLDADNPDFAQLPSVQSDDDGLSLRFQRQIGAAGVKYIIETSTDLATWTPSPDHFYEESVTPNADGRTEEVVIRTNLNLSESDSRLFIRIVVKEN